MPSGVYGFFNPVSGSTKYLIERSGMDEEEEDEEEEEEEEEAEFSNQ
jgi:hypothetical protein